MHDLGTTIHFHVAAWGEQPVCEHVASIELTTHSTNTAKQLDYVRCIAALREAFDSLDRYYANMLDVARPPARFPYFSHYDEVVDGKMRRVKFSYVQQIDDKRVWAVKNEDGQDLIVKICASGGYGVDAHQHAAALQIAPPLVAHNEYLGWMVIVMPDMRSTHECLWDYKRRNPCAHLDYRVCAHVERLVTNIRDRLHKATIVHGDIRDTNILIPRDLESPLESPHRPTALLIDWEWAGMPGTKIYPSGVHWTNPRVPRAPGAETGSLILMEHNEFMMKVEKLLLPLPADHEPQGEEGDDNMLGSELGSASGQSSASQPDGDTDHED